MTDPKHEPVSYRWPEGEYGAWVFANRAPVWPDLPEGGEVEPLYPASTVEALTAEVLKVRKSEAETIRENIKIVAEVRAQLDALKEENERLRTGIKRLSDEEEYCAEVTGDDPFSLVYLSEKMAKTEDELRVTLRRLEMVEHSVRVGSDVSHEREFLAMEARRYAAFYPEASDGRNTFIIFAEMIEAREAARQPQLPERGESVEGGELSEINAALQTINSICLMLQYDHTGGYGVETIEPLRNVAKLINKLVWQQATKERP